MTSKRLSVVIPTYNRPRLLERLLNSLAVQDAGKGSFEVLVVSDGSTDGTHAFLEDFCLGHEGFRWCMQANQGPAAARNYGLNRVDSDIVAFTDDDCEADPGWVQEIIRLFDERPELLGMEGKTVTIREQLTPFTHQIEGSGECYASCNVAYRRQALIKIGGFDSSFFYGNEDVDVAWRMMRKGPVVYNERMVIIHPPISRSFIKFIRQPETYGVEILLYQRHPERYRQVKKRNPLHVIFVSIGLRYFPRELRRSYPLVAGHPFQYAKVVAGLIMQRVWLLFVAPRLLAMYFGLIKQNQAYVHTTGSP